MDTWYNRFLSQAGKEVLLKSVVTALPTYTMSCFMLSKRVLKDITASMCQFWWASGKEKHKLSWVAWNKVTAPKKDEGIGIRDLEAFNIALLAKQAWRLMSNTSSLFARVFKAKYFRKTSFLSARSYTSSSYAWRSIITAQELLKRGVKWIVGNDQHIKVWEDNWLPTSPSTPAQGPGAITMPNMTVKELLLLGSAEWNMAKMAELVHPRDVELIKQIKASVTGVKDVLTWTYARNGIYSVKTGYKAQRELMGDWKESVNKSANIPQDVKEVARQIWNFRIPPKIQMFWWRLAHNSVAVAENLLKRKMRVDSTCQVCGDYEETINHMLFQCRIAAEIWNIAPLSVHCREDIKKSSLLQNIKQVFHYAKAEQEGEFHLFLGWGIWKMRNALLYNNKRQHITHVIHTALMDMQRYKEAQHELFGPRNIAMESQQSVNLQQVLSMNMKYYCIVDASWIASDQRAGLGWSLYRREGIQLLQGSASTAPTASVLHAEAAA